MGKATGTFSQASGGRVGVGIEEGVRERGRRKREKGEGVEKKIEGWGEKDRRERRGRERRKELKKRVFVENN